MDFVMYGGGPPAPLAGDRISEVIGLTSAIGLTDAVIVSARFRRRRIGVALRGTRITKSIWSM